ncbi:MAG: hypothetical protein IJE46_01240 [Clostridia bacterium]|nr:hypothetical protein [Clostridia bacterium]
MEEREIDIWGLVQAVLKRWWLVAIITILSGSISFGYSKFAITPLYSARGTLYITIDNTASSHGGTSLDYNSILAAQELTNTYSLILSSNTFYKIVAAESGLNYNYKEISRMVSMSNENESEIMSITATCPNREHAAIIVETMLNNAQAEISRVVIGGSVRIIDHPEMPLTRSYPNVTKNVFLCLILGVVLGCALAILIEWLDDTVKNSDDVMKYGIPVLAEIPLLEAKSE